MKSNDKELDEVRHPGLWVVQAVRWEFAEGKPGAPFPVDKPRAHLGQGIERVELPDRAFAVAVAHHMIDRNLDEAAGRMSLEIHIHPPGRDAQDESFFRVGEEVIEQARALGLEGDVEQQVKRMARDAKVERHPGDPRRFDRFLIDLDGNTVVSISLADPPRGRPKPRR